MKTARVDQTVIRLAVEMSPDEAECLRNALIAAIKGAVEQSSEISDDGLVMLGKLRDTIGRVF